MAFELNKDKKYTFAGEEYVRKAAYWAGGNGASLKGSENLWDDDEFQYFADAGLVAEVREPAAGRVRATVKDYCVELIHPSLPAGNATVNVVHLGLPQLTPNGTVVEIVTTEVL